MSGEMSAVLSDLGVPGRMVYEEDFFNFKHRPDPAFLEQLRERFVAADLTSPRAHREALEHALQGRRARWLLSRGSPAVPRPEPAGWARRPPLRAGFPRWRGHPL